MLGKSRGMSRDIPLLIPRRCSVVVLLLGLGLVAAVIDAWAGVVVMRDANDTGGNEWCRSL